MSNFSIRFAVRKDTQTIYDFIKGIASYERMADEVEGTPAEVEHTLFDEKQAEVILGEENGIPVGFALFFHNYSTFKTKRGLYLEDLFVIPSVRGKGYGKALLLELVKIARERGCGRMEWTCLDWNRPSIDFYKGIGAVAMDSWTVYRLNEEQLYSGVDGDKA